MMNINLKGDPEDIMEILSNTYGCANCGIPISYKISKVRYCLNCSLKYGLFYLENKWKNLIRKYKNKVSNKK